MTNIAVNEKETDKVINFINETKEGKYTTEKPDLTHITYTRMEIQEGGAANTFNDYPEEVILYGMTY